MGYSFQLSEYSVYNFTYDDFVVCLVKISSFSEKLYSCRFLEHLISQTPGWCVQCGDRVFVELSYISGEVFHREEMYIDERLHTAQACYNNLQFHIEEFRKDTLEFKFTLCIKSDKG